MMLSNDPIIALAEIAAYLNTLRLEGREVYKDGELLGYWQTSEWLEGLLEIAKKAQTVARQEAQHRQPKSILLSMKERPAFVYEPMLSSGGEDNDNKEVD